MKTKLHNTSQLFYKKYTYNISVHIFSPPYRYNEYLSNNDQIIKYSVISKKSIPNLIKGFDYSEPLKTYEIVFIDLLSILGQETENYQTRAEWGTISVFTNNANLILTIKSINNINIKRISMPKNEKIKEYLLAHKNCIVKSSSPHKFKITCRSGSVYKHVEMFQQYDTKDVNFTSTDLYVSNKYLLNLFLMMLGNDVKKVQDIVLESEIL